MSGNRTLRLITFDHDKIRVTIDRPNFSEARRLKGPLYEVLVRELYEDGCRKAAVHFEALAKREACLLRAQVVRDALYQNRNLLYAIVENVKLAEKASQLAECNGVKACFTLLYETLKLLEPHKKYDWLLIDVFKIIANLCTAAERKRDAPTQVIARIYFKYAMNIQLEKELTDKMYWLQQALNLTRGTLWYADEHADEDTRSEFLSEAIARELVYSMLKYARTLMKDSPKTAIEIADKAILIILEAGERFDINLICRANLEKVDFLLRDQQLEAAIEILKKLQDDIMPNTTLDITHLFCEVYKSEAVLWMNLDQPKRSLKKFQEALTIARKHKLKRLEADIVFNLGKLFLNFFNDSYRSKLAFERARDLFDDLKEVNKKKKAVWLLSKLKANEIFPHFINLLKDTEQTYCNFSSLLEWKCMCKPFWSEMPREEDADIIHCLLEAPSAENLGDKLKKPRVPSILKPKIDAEHPRMSSF